MERAGALEEENQGLEKERGERGGVEESWDTVVAEATEKEKDQKLGESPISSEKMPESGDERTIRPNESQGEAVKTDLG